MKDAPLEARLISSIPREPRERLKRHLLTTLLSAILWFVLIAGFLVVLRIPVSRWWLGPASVGLSLLLVATSPVWMPKILSARAFYAAEATVRLPTPVLLLSGGGIVLLAQAPPRVLPLVSGGLLIGLAFIPMMVRGRRAWIRRSLQGGHLQRSWDAQSATWDATFDLDHVRKDPRVYRPSAVWKLAFWIGPAIGMSLAGLVGQLPAILLVSSLLVLIGYGGIVTLGVIMASWWLELLALERYANRRVLLKALP